MRTIAVATVVALLFAGCASNSEHSVKEELAAYDQLSLADEAATAWQEDAYLYGLIGTEILDDATAEAVADNATDGKKIRSNYLDSNLGDGLVPVWEYRYYSDTLGAGRAFLFADYELIAEFDLHTNAKPLEIKSFLDSTEVAHDNLIHNASMVQYQLMELCEVAYWGVFVIQDGESGGYLQSANGAFGPQSFVVCIPGGIQEFGQYEMELQLGGSDAFQFEIRGEYHQDLRFVVEPIQPAIPMQDILLTHTNNTGIQTTFNHRTGSSTFHNGFDGSAGEHAVLAEMTQGALATFTVYWCTDGYPLDTGAMDNPACRPPVVP